jgi:hypothetical protein
MSYSAGYKAQVKKGGVATTFTASAFTEITTNQVFQITDATKRVWDVDPATAFIFYEDAVAIDDSEIESIDLLTGTVTFVTNDKTGTITGSGKYIPVTAIASCFEASVSLNNTIVDATTFVSAQANNGFKSKMATLKDASASLNNFYEFDETFTDALVAGTPLLIHIDIAGDASQILKGWFMVESDETSSPLEDLSKESISLQATDRTVFGGAYLRYAHMSI